MHVSSNGHAINGHAMNGHTMDGHTIDYGYPVQVKETGKARSLPQELAAPTHFEHDVLTRPRDNKGNRLPLSHASSIPVVEDVPLAETPLASVLELVSSVFPATAAMLHHFYDHRLLPSLRRLLAVRSEEEAKLTIYRTQAEAHNAVVDQQASELKARLPIALAPLIDQQQAVEEALTQAHQQTAVKMAQVGREYDPRTPSETSLLQAPVNSLESIAADLRLPWIKDDHEALLSKLWRWFSTALIGAMIGISMGIMAGMLAADNLFGKPGLACVCMLVGFAAALLGKSLIQLSFREASQRAYLGHPMASWLPFTLLAFGVGLSILLIDSVVEREGLMVTLRLKESVMALSNTPPPASNKEKLYFLASVLLTFGYVGSSAWEGYLSGRQAACLNRLKAHQEQQVNHEEKQLREDPTVREALDALSQVQNLLRQQARLTQQKEQLIAEHEQTIAQLKAQRRGVPEELSLQSKERIQDALDNFYGAQDDFDRLLLAVISRLEGRSTPSSQRASRSASVSLSPSLTSRLKRFFGQWFKRRESAVITR